MRLHCIGRPENFIQNVAALGADDFLHVEPDVAGFQSCASNGTLEEGLEFAFKAGLDFKVNDQADLAVRVGRFDVDLGAGMRPEAGRCKASVRPPPQSGMNETWE